MSTDRLFSGHSLSDNEAMISFPRGSTRPLEILARIEAFILSGHEKWEKVMLLQEKFKELTKGFVSKPFQPFKAKLDTSF